VLDSAQPVEVRAVVVAQRVVEIGVGAYANYADPDLTNALRSYYGANLERLRRVKHAVDPAGRFRPAQGIR